MVSAGVGYWSGARRRCLEPTGIGLEPTGTALEPFLRRRCGTHRRCFRGHFGAHWLLWSSQALFAVHRRCFGAHKRYVEAHRRCFGPRAEGQRPEARGQRPPTGKRRSSLRNAPVNWEKEFHLLPEAPQAGFPCCLLVNEPGINQGSKTLLCIVGFGILHFGFRQGFSIAGISIGGARDGVGNLSRTSFYLFV